MDVLAAHLAERQMQQIGAALDAVRGRLAGRCETVLLCGEGEVLLRRMAEGIRDLAGIQKVSLHGALGEKHSRAACAFALARLLTEDCARNDGTRQN
jgi:uncharacterized hydantoinase/oxoprolinase family protein